jgi:hypothetical protein
MPWRGRFGVAVAFVLLASAGGRTVWGDASPPAAAPAKPAVHPAAKPAARPTQVKAAAVHVRREIHQLSAPEIDAFRAGVALMKSRAEKDPTSWAYQANIHGFPTSGSAVCAPPTIPAQTAWATCQHGQFFFTAWHRMYVYYFERILRAAIREATKDPTYEFSLPYWDYENASYHDLPQPFRVPAGNTNSLYVAQRAANCNSGSVCVDGPTASAQVALSLTPFCTCPGSSSCCNGCLPGLLPDETFGGQFVPQPVHYMRAFGELESQPHNVVHDAIGGDTGWMADPDCAARDPIFWLHHANIDRLWQVWLNQGGRLNPINCSTWSRTPFTFFDEKGQKVTKTACDILNMVTQLDYQYDKLPVNNVQLCSTPPVTGAQATTSNAPPKRQLLAASPKAAVTLGEAPVKVSVPVAPEAKQRFEALASGGAGGHMRLIIEGLELLHHGAYYRVFLNLPEGQAPDPAGPYYIGQISLFGHMGHGEAASRSFDITKQVQALRRQGQWKGNVDLTFVRANPRQGAEAKAAPQTYMRMGKVSIVER